MCKQAQHRKEVIRSKIILEGRDMKARGCVIKISIKVQHVATVKNGGNMIQKEENKVSARACL